MRNVLVILIIAVVCIFPLVALADYNIGYVCVDEDSYLNGREHPNKHSAVTMRLYCGDEVEIVGVKDGWIEIIGGESGTSFVDAHYVSETNEEFKATNTSGGRVRIRGDIDGKAIGYVKAGRTVTVTRVISGWGFIGSGWVDLTYFEEEN